MQPHMTEGTPVASGAEGSVYETEFLGRAAVSKVRSPKAYRVPELDSALRSRRTRSEARLLREARRAGVRTPVVYLADPQEGVLVMERVEGPTVKAYLDANPAEAEDLRPHRKGSGSSTRRRCRTRRPHHIQHHSHRLRQTLLHRLLHGDLPRGRRGDRS